MKGVVPAARAPSEVEMTRTFSAPFVDTTTRDGYEQFQVLEEKSVELVRTNSEAVPGNLLSYGTSTGSG